jgi:hypothetical protein
LRLSSARTDRRHQACSSRCSDALRQRLIFRTLSTQFKIISNQQSVFPDDKGKALFAARFPVPGIHPLSGVCGSGTFLFLPTKLHVLPPKSYKAVRLSRPVMIHFR